MRWTALLGASVASAACAGPAVAPAPGRAEREPDLRIALQVGAGQVTVSGQGDVAAIENGRPAFRIGVGNSVTLSVEGQGLQVAGEGAGRYERLSFAALARDRPLVVDGKPYRGALEAFVADGGITVVNIVPLEAYLLGVVNAEMGRLESAGRAALEAQAIVSRTYALKNRGRFGGDGYDLRAGVTDQVYAGVERESALGTAAVDATRGIVVVHGADLISPFFHSTCGGHTAAPEESFRTVREMPYLRAVSDRRPGGHYCDSSPRFRWSVEWDGSLLRDILRRTVPSALGIDAETVNDIRDVYIRRTGPSGRPTEVRIAVGSGEIPVPGYQVRNVFRAPDGSVLGSSAVELVAERDGDRVVRLTARGAGWGHGVGMCQWGAVGRARAGQDARTIVTTYFPGTTLVRWY